MYLIKYVLWDPSIKFCSNNSLIPLVNHLQFKIHLSHKSIFIRQYFKCCPLIWSNDVGGKCEYQINPNFTNDICCVA